MSDLVVAIAIMLTLLMMILIVGSLWLANVLEDRRRRLIADLTPEQRAIYAQLSEEQPE